MTAALLVAMVAAIGAASDGRQAYGPVAASDHARLDSEAVRSGPAPDASAAPTFQLDAVFERRHDRFRYRFENPSTFNTESLVEHFFQQRYDAYQNWFAGRVAYRPSPLSRVSADVGFTPHTPTFGEDLDTFFNAGNNVIVSGTSGEVVMRSIRARGSIEQGHQNGLVARVGYSYRRDRSDFRTPERKITRMSNPPLVEETITFDRERTISQVHQLWIGVTKRAALPQRWHLTGDIDAAPATLARLNTILPDKYPGRNNVFSASGFEVAGRVALGREGRWPIEVSADLGRTFSYRSSAQFVRNSLGVGVRVGVQR